MEENSLWMDKYQPRRLEDLTFHADKTKLLSSLADNSEFPHLILFGPEGAGKKTRVHCFLAKVYGDGIYKMNTFNKEFKNKSKVISYMVTSSNYHLEFCPSDLGNNDKFIISNVVKEASSFTQLDTETQKSFKVIVLLEADKMSKEAQSALRRTMEKYSENCRIIMIVNDLSNIIDPIRSRCFALRIPSPSEEELKNCLLKIRDDENCELTEQQVSSLIKKHGRNVRECITCMQMTSLGNYNDRVFEPEYLSIFSSINKQITKDQSAKSLRETRDLFIELIMHGFPASFIIYKMVVDLIKDKNIKEECKKNIISEASFFDKRAQNGNKDIVHLEGLAAKIMYIIAENK